MSHHQRNREFLLKALSVVIITVWTEWAGWVNVTELCVCVCVCVLLWLYVILKQALDFSTCHSALLSKANKISHEYAVITNANCHHSPPTRCACGCVSVYTYVFAPRAIDIGSVNPILSTSLQQQGIIHKNNLNIYVTWHAKKGHKSSLRLSSHDGVHI